MMYKSIKKAMFISLFTISVILAVAIFVNGKSNNVHAMSFDEIQALNFGKEDGEDIVIDETNENMFTDAYYIPNKNYFIANPRHANNTKELNKDGICTTVAMQILLGYHNYYTDNRLIPATANNGVPMLSADYRNLAEHPDILKKTAEGLGRNSIGTKDEVLMQIYKRNKIASLPGGQAFPFVVNGVKRFVNDYAPTIKDNVSIGWGMMNASKIAQNVLNEGRPIVLGCYRLIGGIKNFHVVVAYGYAKYENEFGFITHYGWGKDNVKVWIPKSQISFYATMNVEHEHKLVDIGKNYQTGYREIECEECGYKTIAPIFKVNEAGDTVIGVEEHLLGDAVLSCLEIPSYINGKKITSIGESFFEGGMNYRDIALSNGIENIGAKAFRGNIGMTALRMPSSIANIGEHAFANSESLLTLKLNSDANIGAFAFADCVNLSTVEDYMQTPPKVAENAFKNDNFTFYVSYNDLNAYEEAFADCPCEVVSKEFFVTYISNDETVATVTAHYGEIIENLPEIERNGHDFGGWYDNPDCEGEPVQNGNYWECEYGITLYAKWTPHTHTVTLNADGGALTGDNTLTVEFGKEFAIQSQATKEGHYLEGWFDENGVKYADAEGNGVKIWDLDEDTVLYARWQIKSYKIRIRDDGFVIWLTKDGFSEEENSIQFGDVIDAINLVPNFKNSKQGYKEGHIFDRFEYEGGVRLILTVFRILEKTVK